MVTQNMLLTCEGKHVFFVVVENNINFATAVDESKQLPYTNRNIHSTANGCTSNSKLPSN